MRKQIHVKNKVDADDLRKADAPEIWHEYKLSEPFCVDDEENYWEKDEEE